MLTTKDAQVPAPTTIQHSDLQTHHELLAGLIAAAGAALDNNRDIARACIEKAAALLENDAARDSWQARSPAAQRGGLAPWQAKRVQTYVAVNLGGRIRTTDLAEVAQLSTSHFTRAFKETFGETPIGYVARRRMLYAQELMLKSRECLSQIALKCGHCDQSHFTRVFRRKVGMSPREWRRQFAGEACPSPHRPDPQPFTKT
jgi:AraC family transcriptional regulator